jgi:hypothetical protein
VEIHVTNVVGPWASVYVQGAPELTFAEDGTMTIDNVADLGPGVLQRIVGISGEHRNQASGFGADVLPGQTVPGGDLTIAQSTASHDLGTGDISWKADGSALAYGMRTLDSIRQIPASPPYGSIGEDLPVVDNAMPYLVAWGPTEETRDLYLYFTKDNWQAEGVEGIYLNAVGEDGGGVKLMKVDVLNGEMVYDIEWLPDASGFLFSMTYIDLGTFTDIVRYDFGDPPTVNLVTTLPDYQGARAFSISPDGQQVVFEWLPDIFLDQASSLWIINSDGSGEPRKLADDAGRPAWGPVPPPLTPRAWLPMVVRKR